MSSLQFDSVRQVCEAPDGVNRLRQLILDLAVEGRLLPGFTDSPRRRRLLTLPEVANYRIGKTPPSKEARHWDSDGLPWVSISDMEHFGTLKSTSRGLSRACVAETFKYPPAPAGSLLMSFKLTVGKVCILGVDGYHNEAIISIQPKAGVSRDYLMRVLPSIARQGKSKDALMGATLNSSSLAQLVVPLPELEEQLAIVAKVDELMALCDQLEARQQNAEAAHARLVKTLLDSLVQARDADQFQACWLRLTGQFQALFNTPASINGLWSAVLCLAAEGKLVAAGEQVAQLPIGELLLGDTLNGCSYKPSDAPVGIPILRISAGTGSDDFIVNEADHKWVEVTDVEREKFRLLPNDLLACRFNGNLHYVGAFAIYNGASGVEQIFPAKLIRFRVDDKRALPGYLRFVMNALPARKQIESFCATTVGNIGISATNLKTVKVRVPSLDEQHRIVAKVTELLALCEQLKARLTAARAKQAQLAEALVEAAGV